jgi:RHS repeat-associated protein
VVADRAFAPYGEVYDTFGTINQNETSFTGDTEDEVVGNSDTPNRQLQRSAEGRWLSPDPAQSGWNPYAYATNPNSWIDPLGLSNCPNGQVSCGGPPRGPGGVGCTDPGNRNPTCRNSPTNPGADAWNDPFSLWFQTALAVLEPAQDATLYYPYGWIDAETGNLYPAGVYVYAWNFVGMYYPGMVDLGPLFSSSSGPNLPTSPAAKNTDKPWYKTCLAQAGDSFIWHGGLDAVSALPGVGVVATGAQIGIGLYNTNWSDSSALVFRI